MAGRGIFKDIYSRLYRFYGPQGWWPGDTRLEIIVGAILTQNTAWVNVEKAITNLKEAKLLSSPAGIEKIPKRRLARIIRPAGYYNVKAERLKNFISFLSARYDSSLNLLSRTPTSRLREELLAVNGIGPETCDSILLYAFKRPVFVIDAYTRRIFSRHGIFPEDCDYHEMQSLFMKNLPSEEGLFNEYHALIVRLGKDLCRKAPRCGKCPLKVLANRNGRYYNIAKN